MVESEKLVTTMLDEAELQQPAQGADPVLDSFPDKISGSRHNSNW